MGVWGPAALPTMKIQKLSFRPFNCQFFQIRGQSRQKKSESQKNCLWEVDIKDLQLLENAYIRLPFYEANLWVLPIAYHRLNKQLCS